MARRTSGRIKRPANPKELLDLANVVYQKHTSDGAASLLNNLDGDIWTTVGPTVALASAKHQEAEDYKRKMEEAYRERDRYLPTITEAVNASSALLKAVHRQNPKRLGEWGFNIDDSIPVKKNPNKETNT
jgi:hypothetical protein